MSVNVFGRQLPNHGKRHQTLIRRGPRGRGFLLTFDHQYDMNSKRLCNIGDAREENDAVSLKVLNSTVSENCYAAYVALEKKIKKLSDTVETLQLKLNEKSLEGIISEYLEKKYIEKSNN